MTTLPKFVAPGRLADLHSREDASLIAFTVGAGTFADYRITRYNSRKALEAFCKAGSSHHALIKTPVARNMFTNRNHQRVTS